MKVALGEIAQAFYVFQKLTQEEPPVREGEKPSSKTLYRIARLFSAIRSEFVLYEQQRLPLVKKFGTKKKDKEGNETEEIEVTPENLNEFYAELNPLNAIEVEINRNPLSFSDLETFDLSAGELTILLPFIQDDEEEETTQVA